MDLMSKGYLWQPDNPAKQRCTASKHTVSKRSLIAFAECQTYWPEIFCLLSVPRLPLSKHCMTLPYMPLHPDVHSRYWQVPLTEDNQENLLRKACFHHCLIYLPILPTWRGGLQILSMVLFYSLPHKPCWKRALRHPRSLSCCLAHPACCSHLHPAHSTDISSSNE